MLESAECLRFSYYVVNQCSLAGRTCLAGQHFPYLSTSNQCLFSEERAGMKITAQGKYEIYHDKKNYSDARRFCTLNGGHLVAFETEAEFDAFGTFPDWVWVGADDNDTEGEKLYKIFIDRENMKIIKYDKNNSKEGEKLYIVKILIDRENIEIIKYDET